MTNLKIIMEYFTDNLVGMKMFLSFLMEELYTFSHKIDVYLGSISDKIQEYEEKHVKFDYIIEKYTKRLIGINYCQID